jgi:glutaredoxin-like protein
VSDASPTEQPTEVVAPDVVTVFWRPGCGFCSMLRHSLQRAGVKVEEHDIWQDPDAAAFVRSVARGHETVPTVVVAGRALVNPQARQVIEILTEAGYPPSA